MILLASRLLLSTAALAIIFSSPTALLSQTPVTFTSLPEAPQPQNEMQRETPAAAAPSTALVAEASSSSNFPAPEEQAQSSAQTGAQTGNQTGAQTSGQTPAPPPDHPLTEEERKAASEIELQKQLKQRLGGIVPNFNAVLDGSTIPLTPGQKMRAAFRSAIDPYQFGLAFITSGFGQATDSHSSIDPNGTHHGYPQGWAGFGCRYGANYVDQFNGTIIGNGILPVLLRQDPRYFRMGTGTFKKRLLYSLETTVVARGDNGKKQPNYSNVLGNIVSGGISNLYYPKAEHGFALTMEQGLTVTAEGSIGALLIEFYPDIRHHFSKKNHPQTAQPAP